jgi:hypothetical protein
MRSIPGAPPPCGGAYRARGRVELRNIFWVDPIERVMHGIPASIVYVPLEHGEIDHPSESRQIGISQLQALTEFTAHFMEASGNDSGLVSYQDAEVDQQDRAMIMAAMHPACQRHLLTTIFRAERFAGVYPKHAVASVQNWWTILAWKPRFSKAGGVTRLASRAQRRPLLACGTNSRLPGESAV